MGSTAGHVHAASLTSDKPIIHEVFQRVLEFDKDLNHLIATLYKTEKKNISAHSDKTADLVLNSFIYLFSFGPTRQMVFRNTETKKQVHLLDLTNGSCFIMGPIANATHTHEVPPLAIECGERISLIFRAASSFKTVREMAKLRKELARQVAGEKKKTLMKDEEKEAKVVRDGKESKEQKIDDDDLAKSGGSKRSRQSPSDDDDDEDTTRVDEDARSVKHKPRKPLSSE